MFFIYLFIITITITIIIIVIIIIIIIIIIWLALIRYIEKKKLHTSIFVDLSYCNLS